MTTKEQLAVLEEKMKQNDESHDRIEKKIDHNCNAAETNFQEVKQMFLRLEDKVDEALDKKAGKWVEKVIIGFVLAMISAYFYIINGQ